jgi:WD40 repeat protein
VTGLAGLRILCIVAFAEAPWGELPMPVTTSGHPSVSDLAAFALGKLDTSATETVNDHIAGCDECRTVVETTPNDSLVALLRNAPIGTGNTPSPSQAGSPTTGTLAVLNPTFDEAALPPELRNHPRYRILRKLGEGGMGAVYEAEHKMMERVVAVKVIAPGLVDSPDAIKRFQREVRAAAKLEHANIVRAYDAEQAGDLQLLAMEFVGGRSLTEVLHKNKPLPIANACHYVRQAALGLQHAFEQGMVHRDLKPQNLMLTPKGVVKILDFGLAKLASEQNRSSGGLTLENTVMGTPEYMAPEQAINTKSADIRADIYALGCTLYCLLTGRPPFIGEPLAVIIAQSQDAPPPVESLRPEVPAGLAALVARLLAKNPVDRLQTPKELADALTPFTKAKPKSATPPPHAFPLGSGDPFAELDARPARPGLNSARQRPRLIPAAVTAAVLFLAAAVAGIVMTIKTPDGIVNLQVDPSDAKVEVAEGAITIRPRGENEPYTITVPKGGGKLRISKAGFEVVTKEVTLIDKGQTLTVALIPNVTPRMAAPPKSDPVTPKAVQSFTGHQDTVDYLLFTPDGTQLISASNANNSSQGWAAGGKDRFVRVWSIKTGLQTHQFLAKDEKDRFGYTPQGLAISPDGRYLATVTSWSWARVYQHSRVFVWDMFTLKRKQLLLLPENNAARSISFSKDGKIVYVSRSGSSVNSFSLADGAESSKINLEDQAPVDTPLGTTLTPGGRYVIAVVQNQKGPFSLWDRENGKVVKTFLGHTQTPSAFAMSLDETRILSCAGDSSVRLWETESASELFRIDDTGSNIVCVAFSPDAKRFLTGSADGTVTLYDVTGKMLAQYSGHYGKVRSVVFSPTGSLAASGGEDTTIRVWKLPEPRAPDPLGP